MGIKFRLHEEDGNHDSYYIGSVVAPEGMTQKQAEEIISAAWGEFQETNPEASAEFGAWLVEHHGFVEFENHSFDFIVNE